MNRLFLVLVLLFLLIFSYQYGWYLYGYLISFPTDEVVDVSQQPLIEEPHGEPDEIKVEHDEYDITLKVIKDYTLAGRVLFVLDTRSTFNAVVGLEAFDAEYIPVDLVMGWGNLASKYGDAVEAYHIGVPQGRRALVVVNQDKIPREDRDNYVPCQYGPGDQCWSHSHIIPANERILIGLKHWIKEGREVKLIGHLVNIHKKKYGREQEQVMTTSTILEDHVCEFFYVTRLVSKGRIFE